MLHSEGFDLPKRSPVCAGRYFYCKLLVFLQKGRATIAIATWWKLLLLVSASAAPLSCKISCLCQHGRHCVTRDSTCKTTFNICKTDIATMCKQQSAHHAPSP